MFDPADYDLTLDELPAWMRPRPRGVDWPLLAVLVFCLIVAGPLMVREGLPNSPEATLQMHRIYSMAQSIQSGDFYPRWAPDFIYGYGSPIFNYLAPLPYYLGGLHATIAQAQPDTSFKILFIFSIFTGGVGLFSFIRQRWGAIAGIVGAAIFLFSPYTLQTEPYLHSDLGTAWAVAWLPMVLWAMDRALQFGRGRDLLLLSLTGAALLLSDRVLSPILFVLAGGWLLWIMLFSAKPLHWRVSLVGFLLAASLAAFYVAPAFLERDAIRWQSVAAYPVDYVAPSHVSDLLLPLPPLDESAINTPIRFNLGLATWTLAALGSVWVIIGFVRRLRQRPTFLKTPEAVSFFIPTAIILFRLLLDNSLWRHAQSGFDALQPMDLLGALTLVCAILAAQVMVMIEQLLHRPIIRYSGAGILLLVLVTSAMPAFYAPQFHATDSPFTVNDLFELELRGHALGTFRHGYMLPSNVTALPEPSTALLNSYNKERIFKVQSESLPSYSLISINAHDPTSDDFGIETRQASDVIVLTFNYPGWHAERNDRKIAVESAPLTGFIRIPLEAGSNDVVLRFGNTTLRQWAVMLSAFSLILIGGLTYWLDRRRPPQEPDYTASWLWGFGGEQKWMLAIVTLPLILISIYLRANPSLTTDTSPSSSPPDTATPLRLIVDGGIGFLGYELDTTNPKPGDTLTLYAYWRANRPNLPNYQIAIQLLESRTDRLVTEIHFRHPANLPTNLWPTDGYITSIYQLKLPNDLPTGNYEIALQVESCDRFDLQPCENAVARNIFNLRGAVGSKIILSTPITIQN
ncbi:MAG: hypothetical protein HY862_00960 [Chloroflexi bacterium]|nr:hypothetical protein [Chloroflexota bacterium]